MSRCAGGSAPRIDWGVRRSTPCVDALVESSHARLLAQRAKSSRAWARLYTALDQPSAARWAM
ncbi:hypothetical protein FEO89_13880 [Stenotrophomonas maltophilia]|nr:hypothetical protein FEO89_13880 [Stenotrophomonas maltophilia]